MPLANSRPAQVTPASVLVAPKSAATPGLTSVGPRSGSRPVAVFEAMNRRLGFVGSMAIVPSVWLPRILLTLTRVSAAMLTAISARGSRGSCETVDVVAGINPRRRRAAVARRMIETVSDPLAFLLLMDAPRAVDVACWVLEGKLFRRRSV